MAHAVQHLRGGLVASCQPVDDGPMDRPDIVAAMAQAAVAGGAAGLRIEGIANLRAARAAVDVPIIGIVKSDRPETPVRITVSTDEARALVAAGADIVAFDATDRPRLHSRDAVLSAIQRAGALAMADCATLADGTWAQAKGAAILGTTLSGYTAETAQANTGPDFDLLRAFRGLGGFVMAEGRFDTPDLCGRAMAAGADAVTVGSSLTRLEVVTGRFVQVIQAARRPLDGFAVDLGGTKTAAARIVSGTVAQHLHRPTVGAASPEDQIQVIEALLADLGYRSGDPLGVAVTGRVDQEGRWSAVNRDTLTQIDNFPLAQRLCDQIGPARVLNDAAAATLAEHRLGAGRGHENFAFITVSTGVGGGLILNNRLHQSANGLAGHIGFASTRGGHQNCGSGRVGTVESQASGRAIAAAAGHQEAQAVFAAAATGAPLADGAIDASASAVADLIADLAAMLGVSAVALGGGIGLAEGYLARVERHLNGLPQLFRPQLTHAKMGVHSPLFGALVLSEELGAGGWRPGSTVAP